MIYTKEENKIIINDLTDFNIEHILECGQIFTYKKLAFKEYEVYSCDKYAYVKEYEDKCEIITKDVDYFINFFDLETDYKKIKTELLKDKKIKDAINFGYGIRILKQDIVEIIIGFIISANNNIERIKTIMAKIRTFGKNKGKYFAFPTIKELSLITEEQFRKMGAGYRAKYLVSTSKDLLNANFDELKKLETKNLKNWLLNLKGVGPKVADCILLFGFSRCDSFPVDTWIEKVYIDIFGSIKSREQMSKDFINYFKDLSGYAQQYLFFYKRSF